MIEILLDIVRATLPPSVIGCYFCSYFLVHFQSNLTSHSLPHLSLSCLSPYVYLFMSFTLTNRRQEHDLIVQLVTEQLDYGATDIPKQSSLGARGQLPSGSMLSIWRVLKQFAQLLPSG